MDRPPSKAAQAAAGVAKNSAFGKAEPQGPMTGTMQAQKHLSSDAVERRREDVSRSRGKRTGGSRELLSNTKRAEDQVQNVIRRSLAGNRV